MEAQPPHAEPVPFAQRRGRDARVGDGDAAEATGKRASASSTTLLSKPWALPCTITPRAMPRWSCSAMYSSTGASGGV